MLISNMVSDLRSGKQIFHLWDKNRIKTFYLWLWRNPLHIVRETSKGAFWEEFPRFPENSRQKGPFVELYVKTNGNGNIQDLYTGPAMREGKRCTHKQWKNKLIYYFMITIFCDHNISWVSSWDSTCLLLHNTLSLNSGSWQSFT